MTFDKEYYLKEKNNIEQEWIDLAINDDSPFCEELQELMLNAVTWDCPLWGMEIKALWLKINKK